MDSPETPTPRVHRGFLTAGAVVAMVLAGLGIAGAQTADTPPTTQAPAAAGDDGAKLRRGPGPGVKPNLAVAAQAIGVSQDELRAALRNGHSIAQVAESKGVDVQKVIDALVADAQATLPDRMREAVNRVGKPGGPGHHHGHRGPKAHLSAAATALGITDAELRIALRSGQSIAQVAESKGVDVQKVIDALAADMVNRTGRPRP